MRDLTSMTLTELQQYVASQESVRGFDDESAIQKCLLLGEEVGELFKAVRQATGMQVGAHSQSLAIADELADVLNFLFAIAIRFDLDLGEAFAKKEATNCARVRPVSR